MHSPNVILRTTVVHAFTRTLVDAYRPWDGSSARSDRAPSSAPERADLPAPPDLVGGHYKLLELLGEGMFGKVYVARRVDVPEHRVALKLLPRALYAGRNVERELVMLATVGHPHVVQLKDHGTTAEYVWLTMPVYKGETLAERLLRGPLSLREAHDIFLPIARGLDALHDAGLRHQDVKPDNIFLAVFGGRLHPILLDLGVAAERDATFVAGTALFGAPEQVAALSGLPALIPLSEKMDTYGLATTLLYALVGSAHFPGETASDWSELISAQELRARSPLGPAALPDLTGRARELVEEALRRWLALDPSERPAMSDLAEQLDVLLEPEREEERAEIRRAARQRASVQRLKAALGAVLLIGCGAALVIYSKRETLRVASELETARKKGAESFDKLDTCVASHRMARAEASVCQLARDKERGEFRRSLDEVARSGSASEADRARITQSYATRVKTCEDASAAATQAWGEERARTAASFEGQRAALLAERDDLAASVAARKAEVATAKQGRDECLALALSCVQERDACQSTPRAQASVAPPASPPTPPAATAAPRAPHAPPSSPGAGGAAPANAPGAAPIVPASPSLPMSPPAPQRVEVPAAP